MTETQITSTTAPGKIFASRAELALHNKSDLHKYNLKRKESNLPPLNEHDFQARLRAAMAVKRERELMKEKSGTAHLKNQKVVTVVSKPTVEPINTDADVGTTDETAEAPEPPVVPPTPPTIDPRVCLFDSHRSATPQSNLARMERKYGFFLPDAEFCPVVPPTPPTIDPRVCLFDSHRSATPQSNLARMERKYGFFLPDAEFCVNVEGVLGYCAEKIKLGHYCLYCLRTFQTYGAAQHHMIDRGHTKIRYEEGVDAPEFAPFYDFSSANEEFLTSGVLKKRVVEEEDDEKDAEMDVVKEVDDEEWEDVTDDEADDEDAENNEEEDDADGLYEGYQSHIKQYGFEITPNGELQFPDGRTVGHRGLRRYYNQRFSEYDDRDAVSAARRGKNEYYRNQYGIHISDSTVLHKKDMLLGHQKASKAIQGRAGAGVLVAHSGNRSNAAGAGGFTALSVYRYKAVVKKQRKQDADGERKFRKYFNNGNKFDKKGNRLVTDVSVAWALR
eukprot:CAMPEP_0194443942 /NCGR_PEP_ID=MMETSP0176-20130528/126992_1 /TAXON_ID=216777 /ORGANISM="Proboscia alata, Strain PI-D3" /LENGTH=501 /DNA_ID=CAMNT_0039270257 /DNA_START=96 /DNA_END=1602 /DNA_ORIENTATION=+